MAQKWRAPPGGFGQRSDGNVSADSFDTLRNKATPPKKQPGNPKGLHSIGLAAIEAGVDLRFRRQVERVHALGPRVTAELLAEIGAERGIATLIERKLERYAALSHEAVRLARGDRFPALPIHVVRP